jgi:hypothetical protein
VRFRSYCCGGLLIFATQAGLMAQGPSGKAHQRFVHAKGIVYHRTFQASPSYPTISRADHVV